MNQPGIPGRRSMTRGLPWLAAAVTVGTVPYVVLKISWLVGDDVGLRDPALMQTTTYVVANSITLVLDLVVVALAWVLALASPRRLLVVLAPLVWGATGLMVTPVLSAAVIAVAGDPSTERLAGDALYAWVYAVVYLGFAIQGVGIVTLFGVKVVRAWPWLFARRSARISPILVGGASAGALAGLGFLLLASGVERVWFGPAVSADAERGSWVVTGLLCLAGALGSVAAVRRLGLFAIACGWLGTGAMVCWSGFNLLVAAVDAAVAESTPLPLIVLAAVSGVGLVAALVMAPKAMSQAHRLIRLDVEKHPITRLD
jgi:hypothetical protein